MDSNSEIATACRYLESPLQNMKFFSDLLKDGYDLRLKVTGRSMSPFLKNGSLVILSKSPVSELCIGDIIFCQGDDGAFKLHRLIQKTGRNLITKGDALRALDPPFHKRDYKGKVIRIEQHSSGGISHYNMESHAARFINYLIARYYQLKICFTWIYIRIKSIPA